MQNRDQNIIQNFTFFHRKFHPFHKRKLYRFKSNYSGKKNKKEHVNILGGFFALIGLSSSLKSQVSTNTVIAKQS